MTRRVTRGRRRARAASVGFGLLEAIVALALLAATGVALFSWINQNLDAASRLRAHEQQAQLLLSAQALVETVNPMQAPSGRLEAGDLSVSWVSDVIAPPRANATFGEGPATGPWQVGLYRLQVQAQDRRQGSELRFEQWRVGTRRTSSRNEVPP